MPAPKIVKRRLYDDLLKNARAPVAKSTRPQLRSVVQRTGLKRQAPKDHSWSSSLSSVSIGTNSESLTEVDGSGGGINPTVHVTAPHTDVPIESRIQRSPATIAELNEDNSSLEIEEPLVRTRHTAPAPDVPPVSVPDASSSSSGRRDRLVTAHRAPVPDILPTMSNASDSDNEPLVRKRTATAPNDPPGDPSSSSSSSRASTQMPPPQKKQRKAQDDGNAHSNSAAPRRINTSTTPVNIRRTHPNNKLISGG